MGLKQGKKIAGKRNIKAQKSKGKRTKRKRWVKRKSVVDNVQQRNVLNAFVSCFLKKKKKDYFLRNLTAFQKTAESLRH